MHYRESEDHPKSHHTDIIMVNILANLLPREECGKTKEESYRRRGGKGNSIFLFTKWINDHMLF